MLSITCSAFATFLLSPVLHKGKFEMEEVLNATLAGGVIIGTSCDMVAHIWVAMVIGFFGGVVSTLGFRFLTPFLASKLKLHDTCGVLNLHGIPGILAGLLGALIAAVSPSSFYDSNIENVYPGRGTNGDDRTAVVQGLF